MDNSETQEWAQFTKTRLPQMLEANLRPRIDRDLASVESNLRQLLPDIVRSCEEVINQSFQVWRERKTPPSSSSQTDSRSVEAQPTEVISPVELSQNQESSQMLEFDFPSISIEKFDEDFIPTWCCCCCHKKSRGLAGMITPIQ